MRSRQLTTVNRICLLFVAILFVGAGCATTTDGSKEVAEDFTLESFEGGMVSLSDFEGQPIFIDFWAAWCIFCLEELPEIEKIHQQYDDLVVIGVHRSETEEWEKAQAFALELGVRYLMLKDEDGSVYKTYGGGRPLMPLAILIDREGNIQDRLIGPKTAEQMEGKIMSLLGEDL